MIQFLLGLGIGLITGSMSGIILLLFLQGTDKERDYEEKHDC